MYGKSFGGTAQQNTSLDLREIVVRTVASGEEQRYHSNPAHSDAGRSR